MTAILVDEPKQRKKRNVSDASGSSKSFFHSKDTWIGILGGLALYLSFPPVGAWPLAWVAPIGWIYLSRKETLSDRPFAWLYLAGCVHWLALVYWIRLPHWAASLGWLLLAAYLAVYVPTFVLTTRFLIRSWRIPSVIAAPTVWTGLELIRGYAFTGFSISLLGHSQVKLLSLIQIADTLGGYGVSFLIVVVAAAIERFLFWHTKPNGWKPLLFAILCLLCAIGYGNWQLQLSASLKNEDAKPINVALIQGAYDTIFDEDEERSLQAFDQYFGLSSDVVERRDIDLIIWPESMFSTRLPYVTFEEPIFARPDLEMSEKEIRERLDDLRTSGAVDRKFVAGELKTTLLVGSARAHYHQNRTDRYNSALLISPDGEVRDWYDKRHRVMFGEYIPFGDYFPWVYKLSPLDGGLTVGMRPMSFDIRGVRFTPFICFENTVPHLVRRQMNELRKTGATPDCMVTITNDGWFWGSSLLDVHLACGVFRAIEMDRPMLIAANTGFSAAIDRDGRILNQGARRAESTIISSVSPSPNTLSVYQRFGDLFAITCMVVTVAGMTFGVRNWRNSRRNRHHSTPGECT